MHPLYPEPSGEPTEGYMQAAEFLMAQARDNAASLQSMRPRDMELHLTATMVPASEYADWVDVPASADSSAPIAAV